MFTISSGAEVPKETMVNPMAKSEMFFFFAMAEAPFTIFLKAYEVELFFKRLQRYVNQFSRFLIKKLYFSKFVKYY